MGWYGKRKSPGTPNLPPELVIQPFPGGPVYECDTIAEIASIPLTLEGLEIGWPRGRIIDVKSKTCAAGKHKRNANDGDRCQECKREYQREYMRQKRQSEQLGDGMDARSLKRAIEENAA